MAAAVLWLVRGSAAQDGPTDGWSGSDRGYTFPPSALLHDGQTFDYIVVGAGGAGAAAAARLALAGHAVLLAEAGADPDLISRIPGAGQALLGSALDWQYDTISNNVSCLAFRDRQCRFSRGRCLGGSTSINFMMYTRASPTDFDELGVDGWAWDDVKPYFLRYEGLRDLDRLPPSSAPYHNTTGTMRLQFFTDPKNPWHSRIVAGYESLNVPFNPDVNAQSQVGVTQVVGYVFENERMSTARGYLARPDVKKRLKVAKLTTCTGVILDRDNVAQGITVEHGLFRVKLRLYARKEVILSAGALATPKILMLSGIGPAEHLQKFNITVKLNLPVGDDMSDHMFPLVFIKVDRGTGIAQGLLEASKKAVQFSELLLAQKGPLTSNGLTDITTFLNSECYDFEKHQLQNDSAACALPTLQFIHAYIDRGIVALGAPLFQHGTDLNDAVTEQMRKVSKDYGLLVLSPLMLQPQSRGTVRLASADPRDPPAIFPNFLSDDRDLDETVRALRILEDLMKTEAFSKNNASIIYLELKGCPSYEEGAEAYWRCYSRHMTHTTFHSVGTAALGRVLDAALRVRGAQRLRVADLSALPRAVRANTAAAAIAIGERVADFILTNN